MCKQPTEGSDDLSVETKMDGRRGKWEGGLHVAIVDAISAEAEAETCRNFTKTKPAGINRIPAKFQRDVQDEYSRALCPSFP